MAEVTVTPFGVVKLKRALQNPRAALGEIGVILQRTSERAFVDQALGTIAWDEPYGGREPFVNVASALKAFNEGRRQPPPRSFRKRALEQSGDLSRSIAFDVVDDRTVVVGSSKLYAGLQQRGGRSEVRITKAGQKGLAKWLNTKRGAKYEPVLGGFVKRQRHQIRVRPRPFIGITDEARADIVAVVEKAIAEDAE